MKNVLSIAALGAVALILGACETELQKAEALPQQPAAGTPFTQSLTKYYKEAAESQWTGHTDFSGSEHLATKAQAAAQGQAVAPDSIDARGPAVKLNTELVESRQRYMQALDRHAADKIPDATARAQVAYDCWIEEASDPVQAVESKWLEKKVRNCRDDFNSAMAQVDEATKPVAELVRHNKYVVYFDNDSSKISPAAMQTLLEAAQAAHEDQVVHINITGGADRTGSARHNQVLSERRAKEVRRILMRNGVDRNTIIAEGRGENDPQIATADGVAEPENRAVTITLERK